MKDIKHIIIKLFILTKKIWGFLILNHIHNLKYLHIHHGIKIKKMKYKYAYDIGEAIELYIAVPKSKYGYPTCSILLKGDGCREFERCNHNDKIKDKVYIYINKGVVAFININKKMDNFNNIYSIDFYKFFYQLYLSMYDGLIDDRRTLITANMALTGNSDDICNLFNISETKLKLFMEGHSEYDKIITLRKLCNYLYINYPIIHKIILDEK